MEADKWLHLAMPLLGPQTMTHAGTLGSPTSEEGLGLVDPETAAAMQAVGWDAEELC